MILTIAGVTILLPRNVRHFAELLGASVLIVLALSYLGLVLVPDLAIHQVTDFVEPEHAGSWRGVFPHKNEAGAAMVIFVLVGLFVARARSVALGSLIVVAATVFLLFTHSKTSLLLLPVTLLVSALVAGARRPLLALLFALGPLFLFNLFSVGSVYFTGVSDLVGQFMADPSFTGRTAIWQFALGEVAARPLTGYGYSAFWGTPQVVFGLSQLGTWATAATDAHNAYLNLALGVGVPGLLLVVAWVVVLPVLDFFRQAGDPRSRWIALFFLRTWLFGLYASSFEGALFMQIGEVWVIFMIAVYGLRYLSVARLAP
jgi:O-antigen ligase